MNGHSPTEPTTDAKAEPNTGHAKPAENADRTGMVPVRIGLFTTMMHPDVLIPYQQQQKTVGRGRGNSRRGESI